MSTPEDRNESVCISTPDGRQPADSVAIEQLHFMLLFRSLERSDMARKNQKLEIKRLYKYADRTEDIRVTGYEPLGATDMMVLLSIVGISMYGSKSKKLGIEAQSPDARILRERLHLENDANERFGQYTETTVNEVAKVGRYTHSGRNYTMIKQSLERLLGVVFKIDTKYNDGREVSEGFNLLTYKLEKRLGSQDAVLSIAVNPRLAEALRRERHYINIDLIQTSRLLNGNARLLYVKLCTWINAGQTKKISADKLCEYLWPDPAKDNVVQGKRRSRMDQVVNQLVTRAGWKASSEGRGSSKIYTLTRPYKRVKPEELAPGNEPPLREMEKELSENDD